MARPIEKKDYQDSDERVATFRISHGKLTAFQEVCATKETSVSQALIGFIDSVIGGGDIPEKESHIPLPENMATVEMIESAITELQTKFDDKLGEFKSLVADTAITDGTMKAAITPLKLQIKRLQGLIFNAPIDLGVENERPFFTLDERVKYLELELGELKKGQRDRVTAISDLRNEFANKLGDFRSEVADTAITDGTMRAAIAPLKEEIENLKKLDGIE
jgi:archaellum component FlaC